MTYSLEIHRMALKNIDRLPDNLFKKVNQIIDELKSNPRPKSSVKLKARSGDVYRIRAGGYRLVYEVDDFAKKIRVLDFDKRSDVYREKR